MRNLSSEKTSKILLVDDHPVVIAGLESFASTQADLEIVGVARRGSDAVRRARELQPDIVVIDASLPDMSVLQATRLLRAACPRCRVLALAMAPSAAESRRLMQAGAFGYVTKHATRETLLGALRTIARGERHFPPLPDADPLEDDDPPPSSGEAPSRVLSRRELQVLIAIAEGKTNKQIADRLGISVRTVETHRENLMRKLGVQGAAALTRWAITQGLVDPRK